MKKLWNGRFSGETDKLVEEFTQSVSFDRRLALYDIMGSKVHALMLARQGIISKDDADSIIGGLDKIAAQIEAGEFVFNESLEDVHMNIEAALTRLIGEAGGRLHTARSRNDQVATDLRLYLRDVVERVKELISGLQESLLVLAEHHKDAIMPGYTHLQRAQPVLFAHHLGAYLEMLERDYARMGDASKRINVLPLGSGALAGSSFDLDREFVAKELNFDSVSLNSMDAVSDRDFVIEFVSAAALVMVHLSRLSEELVLWSSREFGFVELPDEFCTGSSIMPQKKNPDVAELIRGKTGRVLGSLVSLVTMMKGLPLSYNRDMQEDKQPLFDVIDTVTSSLQVMAAMLPGIKVKEDRMKSAASEGFILATDLADALTRQGIPFRVSHGIVGNLVKECESRGIGLEGMSEKDFGEIPEAKAYADILCGEIGSSLDVEKSVAARKHTGGTAGVQVEALLNLYRKKIAARKDGDK